MTKSGNSNNQNKGESTRISALEKEVIKLKNFSKKQSLRNSKLKKLSLFQFLFFTVLLIMLIAYGIIRWPSTQNATETSGSSVELVSDTTIKDSSQILINIKDSLQRSQQEDIISFYVPEDGIIYSVQFAAYTGTDMKPFEVNMFSLQQYTYQDINQFTLGIFQDYTNAKKFKTLIQQMGFNDAFVIATLNGKRLSIEDALLIKSKTEIIQKDSISDSQTINTHNNLP